jgi:hypothetical protein
MIIKNNENLCDFGRHKKNLTLCQGFVFIFHPLFSEVFVPVWPVL